MTYINTLQTLASAFVLGVLLQHATATALGFGRGYGTTLLQHRKRLILILFLTAASLWANLAFLNFAMPSSTACQVTVVFSSIADHTARILAMAFLLSVVGNIAQWPRAQCGLAAILGTRTVLGLIVTGYARPQLAPICVVRSASLGLSIILLVFDAAVIVGVLVQVLVRQRAAKEEWRLSSATHAEQVKAHLFFLGGYAIWFVTSAPMILGISRIPLFVRVAVPGLGLYLFIAMIDLYRGPLAYPHDDDATSPGPVTDLFPPSLIRTVTRRSSRSNASLLPSASSRHLWPVTSVPIEPRPAPIAPASPPMRAPAAQRSAPSPGHPFPSRHPPAPDSNVSSRVSLRSKALPCPRIESPEPVSRKPLPAASLWMISAAPAEREATHLWELRSARVRPAVAIAPPSSHRTKLRGRPHVPQLRIISSSLWKRGPVRVPFGPGLWTATEVRTKAMAARRHQLKLKRKSRWVAILPEIVESPKALPGQGGVLGVFRLPWGMSDSAYPDDLSPPVRLKEIRDGLGFSEAVPRPTDDDNKRMNDENDHDHDDETHEHEEFDESTLWEIARLLQDQELSKSPALQACHVAILEEPNFDHYYLTPF
ncbi:MAG: hypothetical protein M1826_000537 [Phylliscum demangeonii]|nr:MAG: hypothetical protein M1826_000537 [Phylliscum demangeonii]